MQLINISHKKVVEMATAEIHERPILVQFPNVFVLLAAPTLKGAQQLDALKLRLHGKNYGTAIGSLSRFLAQANTMALPPEFNTPSKFRALKGTFLRLPFRDSTFQSHTIRNGTHQGLLLGGTYNKLFRTIETSFLDYSPDEMWSGQNYCSPLCTSANISGHPEGSITAFDKALDFAKERGIGLFITNKRPAKELGSYPIFGFGQSKVSVHRDGPGLATFKEKIPICLRNW